MFDKLGRDITYLRISLTDKCNLRCRYCMPAEGVCRRSHHEMMNEDEIVTAVEAAASLGIRKVRLTGGEPLVKKNIVSICRRVAAVEGIREVCLTTNGILLPQLGTQLREAGVKRLNLSLDTLNPQKYAYITRIGKLEQFHRGLEAALEAGFEKVKINAVLIGGFNDDEIKTLANLTMMYPVDMRFIELMPIQDHDEFGEGAYVPYSRVLEQLPEAIAVPPDGGVAKLYRLPGAKGNIGLISPISAHFCGECNRIRLTADGKLKPCLHAPDEFSLKGLDFEGMKAVFEQAIRNKPAWHGDLDAVNRSRAGRNMNEIGG
ncbi:MAG: GTP 3',8-cyclase MoaA [Oscillospiraceae bacterium]|nr:GTP 3',8-cyclase MoaA [Oscillospiraceae bacterium]